MFPPILLGVCVAGDSGSQALQYALCRGAGVLGSLDVAISGCLWSTPNRHRGWPQSGAKTFADGMIFDWLDGQMVSLVVVLKDFQGALFWNVLDCCDT